MSTMLRAAAALLAIAGLLYSPSPARAQSSTVMGEVRFDGDTQLDRDSGVWVDGQYLGYVKELKGNKKVMLLPGRHQVSVRQAGYVNFDRDIVVEPGEVMTIQVAMKLIAGATVPEVTSELKVTVRPKRAAVFLDGNYVGHGSELGGKFHSLLVSPGKHQIKIELPGYRTFETVVDVLAGQKSEVKTELVRGSIEQAGADIKKPQ
ncbi:MAG TPA: PEGA domain-containing protein [Candidatus Acidoferrum sp.]|nr:PEGA domain-containing protein [Candidatus Acidoferrum sp.]